MKEAKIKKEFRKWIEIDTWHTDHSNDEKRFHIALFNIFKECGTGISINEFEDALIELVEECHPSWEEEHKEKSIHKFSLRAEAIDSYLSDVL